MLDLSRLPSYVRRVGVPDDIVVEEPSDGSPPRIVGRYSAGTMADEDRKDLMFRLAVAGSQIDGYSSRLDTGTPSKEEVMALGQIFVQSFAFSGLRGKDVPEAVEDTRGFDDEKSKGDALEDVKTMWGEMQRYVIHDQRINPDARSHGTPEKERKLHGKFCNRLDSHAEWRGINTNDAIEGGLRNWEDADWREREDEEGRPFLEGRTTYDGEFQGTAFVDPHLDDVDDMDGGILVAHHPTDDLNTHADRLDGVVTNEGGLTCHAAIVSREHDLPYAAGTGGATSRIDDGQDVRIEGDGHTARVYPL